MIQADVAQDTARPKAPVLGEGPRIDPTAHVRESQLGAWTSVGPRTSIA